MVKAITNIREAIQRAAGAERPPWNPVNTAVRAEFNLPAGSNFKG